MIPESYEQFIIQVPVECTDDKTVLDVNQASLFISRLWNLNMTSFCLSRIVSRIDPLVSYIDMDLSSFFSHYPEEMIRDVKVFVTEKSSYDE